MGALISVIVPVYNGQDCLINCIESIQQQTYPDKEIILVDDGSTDHTGEICRDLLERYDNIRLISLRCPDPDKQRCGRMWFFLMGK